MPEPKDDIFQRLSNIAQAVSRGINVSFQGGSTLNVRMNNLHEAKATLRIPGADPFKPNLIFWVKGQW